jgi:nitrous oxidase accessory protein NosD
MKINKKLHSTALASLVVLLILIIVSSTASASTLNVGSTAKYKTIQSAVNAAKSGDTIKVASGTYKENVQIVGKQLSMTGTSFPTIYGADFHQGAAGMIFGFKISKNGIYLEDGAQVTIRNNAFIKNGVSISGLTCIGQIINNKFTGCGIALVDTADNVVQGNYISGAKIGLIIAEDASCKTVTKNTFTGCNVGVQVHLTVPSYLIGNKYSKNKVNVQIIPY